MRQSRGKQKLIVMWSIKTIENWDQDVGEEEKIRNEARTKKNKTKRFFTEQRSSQLTEEKGLPGISTVGFLVHFAPLSVCSTTDNVSIY